MPKQAELTSIQLPALSNVIAELSCVGMIKSTETGYIYIDIDDAFIHRVFDLISDLNFKKPNYFTAGKNHIGAHISVAYAEEIVSCEDVEVALSSASFSVEGLYQAVIQNKQYIMLKVLSPEIASIRAALGLSDQLNFKGYWIGLHITVACDS